MDLQSTINLGQQVTTPTAAGALSASDSPLVAAVLFGLGVVMLALSVWCAKDEDLLGGTES